MSLRLSSHFLDSPSDEQEDFDAPRDFNHDRERDHDPASSSSEDDEDEADLTWEDWVSDSASKVSAKSLFDDSTFPSVEQCMEHDKSKYGVDVNNVVSNIGLDFHGRIRLINWIRKEKPTPERVNALKGSEDFLKSDEHLVPVLEDDPLLQTATDDWSDSEDEQPAQSGSSQPSDLTSAEKRIKLLEKKLQQAKQDFVDYRKFVGDRLNLAGLAEALKDHPESSTHVSVPLRDDDSHYFQSYGENDIHAVMIQDKVRTATYANFILRNPDLFKGATVLDVGCGTGILSLFAARAGAARVFAVDASDIAEKAEKIVKENGLDNVITVIRGKIEDVQLPDDIKEVDIIVSEWMGYALLYESMLDSVLKARDRFLRPGGVMSPSQCQMMLALCDAADTYKERIGFWSDIYGFDLSAMAGDIYDDAIVDIVSENSLASEPFVLKDLFLREITTKQLDFSAPFTLVSTADKRTKVRALILYFDTFFTADGDLIPEGTEVHISKEGDPILAEVWQVGSKPHIPRRMSTGDGLKKPRRKMSSFSTGPLSIPTHWKQTLFMLKDPITVTEGTTVKGTFSCRKSDTNSRELEVEIRYVVKQEGDDQAGDAFVQSYKVR